MLENQILVFALLLLAVLLAPLLSHWTRIPSIIILILTGLTIGPNGFGIIAQNDGIKLFSTIGLLYIMFIAGIDLDLEEFRASRSRSLLFGILTFFLPAIGGFSAAYWLLGFSLDGALVIACVFSAHTLITYPIASRLGVVKDRAVAITVGGTILTDIAALLLLAVVLGKHLGDLSCFFFIRMAIAAVITTTIIFKVFPIILGWFLRHMEAERGSQFILVLVIMFISAYLAQLSGFEPIIGAFLAGLAINPLIPSSSALMNRIDFMGNTLFIPFFLINVGMSMNVSSLMGATDVFVIAATLSVVSLFSKWMASFITQISSHMTGTQRQLIFGLSGSRAAATLAIVLVGIESGILAPYLLDAAVLMILITCVISSVVTERSARRLVQRERLDLLKVDQGDKTLSITKKASLMNSVLVTVMTNIPFHRLASFAQMLRAKNSTTPLTIATVLTQGGDTAADVKKARQELERYVKEASASEVPVHATATIDYNVADGIIRLARESLADAIVMGWPRKLGDLETLLGEHAGGVISKTDKTVFLCEFPNPLNGTVGTKNRRIILVVPPFADKERGFYFWLVKTLSVAKQLSAKIVVCSTMPTFKRLTIVAGRSQKLFHINFSHWENFLMLRRQIQPSDILITVVARKGSPSYIKVMDQIPFTMQQHFSNLNRIVIYPQQFADSTSTLDSPFTLTVNRAPSFSIPWTRKLWHKIRRKG